MAGHVNLLSRGRPTSTATPKRLKSPHRADCSKKKQSCAHEKGPAVLSKSFPSSFPAFSPPFTPLTPRFHKADKAYSSRKTEPQRSVVREYIRKGIYTSEKHIPSESDTTPRTFTLPREDKAYTSTVKSKNLPDRAFPSVCIADEKRQNVCRQVDGLDKKAFPKTIHTEPLSTQHGSGVSLTVRAAAPVNLQKLDTVDINTIRSCILDNQRKLTELTAELKRIAGPYAVKRSTEDRGRLAARQAILLKEQSAASKNSTRFPSAPASSRPHAGAALRVLKAFHDRKSEVARTLAYNVHRPEKVDPRLASQQVTSTIKDKEGDRVCIVRSASTPAAFVRADGTSKARPLRSVVVLPASTTENATKSIHSNKTGNDLSRSLIKKEPLSAKEVRKLVFAWKSADQQLEDKMNFWVRELPTEVRNRVTEFICISC